MKNKKIIYRAFSISVCLVFLSQNIFAEEILLSSLNYSSLSSENSSQTKSKNRGQKDSSTSEERKIAASFVEHGMSRYEKGDVSGAVGDFSRALLLDPHNREAQRGLIQLASSEKLSAKQKMSLFLLEDLLRNVKALQKRVIYFEDKKLVLTEDLLKKGQPKENLKKEMKVIYDNSGIQSRNDAYQDQKDPLEVVNISLNFEKDQMAGKIVALQKQCARLRQIYRKVEISEQNQTRGASNIKTKEPLNIYAQNFYTQKKDFLIPFQKEALKLEKKVSHVQGRVEELRKQVEKKDKKIDKLTGSLVDSALKLSEKKMLLKEKIDDVASLNTELQDIQSRFELGQRIIQEKEGKIKSLNQLFGEKKFKAHENIGSKEALLAQDKNLKILNEKLLFSEKNLLKTQKLIEDKANEIALLNKTVEALKEKVQDSEKSIKRKTEENVLFQNNFRKNKNKLTKKEIVLKDKRLAKLNGEIKSLQKKLKQKSSRLLAKKEKKFRKILLSRDKKEQEVRKTLSSLKAKRLAKLNGEIKSLQKKLKQKNFKLLAKKKKEFKGILLSRDKKERELSKALSSLKNKRLAKLNIEIKSLQKKLKQKNFKLLAKKRKEFEKILLSRDKKERALSKALLSSEGKLVSAKQVIKKNVDTVSILNRTLDKLHVRFKNNEKTVYKKDKKIIFLQKNLKKKAAKLAKKNQKKLRKSISLKDKKLEEITKILNSSKEELAKIKKLVNKKINEITFLNSKLNEQKIEMAKREEAIQKKNKKIRLLKGRVAKVNGKTERKENVAKDSIEKSEKMLTMEHKLDELNDVLMMYRHGLAEANSKIKERDKRWASVNDEIESLKTKIYTHEKTIKSKEARIQLLKDKLVKNHEDKNEYNEGLRKIIASKVEELNKIKASMEMYKDSLSRSQDKLGKKNIRLKRVNETLTSLKKKFNSGQVVLKAEEVNQLSQMKRLLANEKKMSELEGILAIYREKLSDSHKKMKKKNANIVTLDEQLNFVQVKLFEKNKILKNTRKGLTVLEEQLMGVQEKIAKLRNISGKRHLKQSKVKKEIQDIQSKVKNIHDALLEQLSSFEKFDAHLAIGELN